jgi:alpha-glucosidase (family GH31 glycosyl hydrolase)
MLQYNHFGIPMCGSDICGFNDNTTPEMCQRWQQLGAFYPFSRNHNAIGNIEQDPGVFGAAIANSSRTALRIRYTLLPYLYTLFHLHHTRGDTVARALWHEFPADKTAAGIDRQFLWGSGFLVTPVIDQGQTTVQGYFTNSRWFSYYDGQEVTTRGDFVDLDAPLDFIPLHVHGGNILPTQEPARNTELARNNPFGLIIALNDDGTAMGSLYYDDGNTIDPHADGKYFYAEFQYSTAGVLNSTVVTNGYTDMSTKKLNTIRLFGAKRLTSVTLNGQSVEFSQSTSTMEVTVSNLDLNPTQPFTVTFA